MAVRDGFDGSIKYSADVLDSWNEHLWMEMNRAKCVLFLIASLCPSRKGSISLERIAISFIKDNVSALWKCRQIPVKTIPLNSNPLSSRFYSKSQRNQWKNPIKDQKISSFFTLYSLASHQPPFTNHLAGHSLRARWEVSVDNAAPLSLPPSLQNAIRPATEREKVERSL